MPNSYHHLNLLIRLLAKDKHLSFARLAQQLRQEKSTLLAQLHCLKSLGLPVFFSLSDEMVHFAPLSPLLDWQHIPQHTAIQQVIYYEVLPSTNAFLLQHHAHLKTGTLCLSEFQTAGRGRRGKVWVSPFAGQIMFSLFWIYPKHIVLDGLSLAVGIAIATALQALGLENVALKWPNDIWLNGKKLGGILVELCSQNSRENGVVIGVGINYALDKLSIETPYTALSPHLKLSRESILVAILQQLTPILQEFAQNGLKNLQEKWQQFDAFFGKEVQLLNHAQNITGIAQGIDERGRLKVCHIHNEEMVCFYGGEFSLR